jgi:hypothetical protein
VRLLFSILRGLWNWFVKESEPLPPVVATKPSDGLGLDDRDRV